MTHVLPAFALRASARPACVGALALIGLLVATPHGAQDTANTTVTITLVRWPFT